MWRWLPVVLMFSCVGARASDVAAGKEAVSRGALLLDVRTPAEFASGHVDGAVNVPVQELDEKWASLGVPADREVVVYCQRGRRSAKAKALLAGKGVTKVIDVGAMSNWR